MMSMRITGSIEREIIDWSIGHGSIDDSMSWRDNFGQDVPDKLPKLNNRELIIPEPTEEFKKLIVWALEDFRSHVENDADHWLIQGYDESGKLEYLTTPNYAIKVTERLIKRINNEL